jgi:putative addiction module killer protein
MFVLRQTVTFSEWLHSLSDHKAKASIARRIERLTLGNFGDQKSVGDGVSELRVDVGAGYRVYFIRRGQEIVILLCGGSKRTQTKDIKQAKELAKQF